MSDVHPAPATGQAAFEAAFARLRTAYDAGFPERLLLLRAQVAACRNAPDDDGAFEALHRELHTLAGNAGSFGHVALGEAARAAEHRLDELRPQALRTAGDFEPVVQALERIQDLAPGATR